MDENMKRYIFCFKIYRVGWISKSGDGEANLHIKYSSIVNSHVRERLFSSLWSLRGTPWIHPYVNIQMYIFRRRYPVLPQVNQCL